jgi:hypothetical protein
MFFLYDVSIFVGENLKFLWATIFPVLYCEIQWALSKRTVDHDLRTKVVKQ